MRGVLPIICGQYVQELVEMPANLHHETAMPKEDKYGGMYNACSRFESEPSCDRRMRCLDGMYLVCSRLLSVH